LGRPYLLLDEDYSFTLQRSGDGWALTFDGICFEGVCSNWDAAEMLMRQWRAFDENLTDEEKASRLFAT
jgi:hypothetical protein